MRPLTEAAGRRPVDPAWTDPESSRVFVLTLALALAAHVLLVLGVRIEPPRPDRREASTLEVVVVHQPAPKAASPDKVAAPAQTTQSGGGEGQRDATTRQEQVAGPVQPERTEPPALDLDLELPPPDDPAPETVSEPNSRAFPEPAPPPDTVPESAPDPAPPSAEEPDAQALTATSAQPNPLSLPAHRAEPQAASPAISPAQILASRNQELARLAARIEERTSVFANRPRRTSVSSSTKDYKYATYLEGWRRKVEQVGNINYPEEARRKQLYGNLILRVAVRADGSVEQIQVLRSSGFRVLDEAAAHIVELAAPYAPFPPDIAAETDILDITRTWQFQRNNQLGWGN